MLTYECAHCGWPNEFETEGEKIEGEHEDYCSYCDKKNLLQVEIEFYCGNVTKWENRG